MAPRRSDCSQWASAFSPTSASKRGIRFILNTCRSLYQYASKRRHLPPYTDNPFSDLASLKLHEDDAKPVFVFDPETEHKFLDAADDWSFPIHFLAAKTGLRSGESAHLLIEDLDLKRGWLTVCGKPELGWRVKTRRERNVPLITEVIDVLKEVVSVRTAGPLFLRPRFHLVPAPLSNCGREQLAAACRGEDLLFRNTAGPDTFASRSGARCCQGLVRCRVQSTPTTSVDPLFGPPRRSVWSAPAAPNPGVIRLPPCCRTRASTL